MSKHRRGNGEGTLRQRPNGTWECQVQVEGRRHSFYGPTAKAVRAKAKAAVERIESGGPVQDSSRSIAEWLAHWRITTLAASDRKEATQALYSTLSRKHLEAGPFGQIRLDKLRASDIEALILALRARSLSDSTVRHIYTVLRAGLDGAVRDGLLARNPAALIARPGVKRTEARHLSADEVSRLLKAAADSRHYVAMALIAATGLRKGEALGLDWGHVDLEAATITVVATLGRIGGRWVISEPKSERSRRTIPLSPAMVSLLKKHRTAQKEDRLRAANQWQDSGLVFTTEFGGPVDPWAFLRAVQVAAAQVGLREVNVHTLRHSAAVSWLESGTHIRAVADALGHSSIAITGDIYGHATPDVLRNAVQGLSDQLGLS